MQTLLDEAYITMTEQSQNNAVALAFYERLADAELFMMLECEATGDTVKPMVFETSEASLVLVFDREDRLAEFVDKPVPYIAMPGRRIVQMLASQGFGLGLNLGVAPSSTQIPADGVVWLHNLLQQKVDEIATTPKDFSAPTDLSRQIINALDRKLANMAGVFDLAYLVAVSFEDGQDSHLLALADVPETAKNGVVEAISETIQFCAGEGLRLDISFVSSNRPYLKAIEKHGLKIEIPKLEPRKTIPRTAPGSDPDNPPILR